MTRESTKRQASARDPEETWQSIMDGLGETVLQVSDQDILAESREQGRDPLKEAEDVRRVLLDAIKAIAPEAERKRQHQVRRAGTT